MHGLLEINFDFLLNAVDEDLEYFGFLGFLRMIFGRSLNF